MDYFLNTSGTDIFKKGNLLFGLDKAKEAIRSSRAVILVEGQFDVMALHQVGLTAAVGAQSATLTEVQVTLLDRLGVNTLYPAYDADAAGQRATLAACEAVGRRFWVKVVQLPHRDPADTVLQPGGPEAFRTALRRAVSEPHFRLAEAVRGLDITTPEGKQEALERLKTGLADVRVPYDPVADELRWLTAEKLGVDAGKLAGWANRARRAPASALVPNALPRCPVQYEIMALCLQDPKRVRERCLRVAAVRDPDDEMLVDFLALCERRNYDAATITADYLGRVDGALLAAQLVQPVDTTKKDVLALALNRYMREKLPPSAELSKSLEQAMHVLNDPNVDAEERERNRTEAEKLLELMRLHVALK